MSIGNNTNHAAADDATTASAVLLLYEHSASRLRLALSAARNWPSKGQEIAPH